DDKAITSYLWDFDDDGATSALEDPSHTFDTAGVYQVSLRVEDAEGAFDTASITITVEEPAGGDFALRINAGGPQLTYQGNVFEADANFVGGKVYTNTDADVPVLYQTERSASPPAFGYEIPLDNGTYQVTLHFAEIYWGANGGGPDGENNRVFDVQIEGNTVLNDYDIIKDVGTETVVTKTFEVVVSDGELTMAFDAQGGDGIDQPKLSALEIISTTTVGCGPVPAPWANTDIGNVAADGSACYNPSTGVFEVEASGRDIWDGSDEFHFVYQSLTGDGEIIARVLSLDDTDNWAKAGVMMRNTNAANSALVLMALSPNPQPLSTGISYHFQDRPSAGTVMIPANNNTGTTPVGAYPYYVRLVRQGNTFTGYASATNGNWQIVGSKTIAMNETIQVGLATTSHDDGVITTASYDNVSVIQSSLSAKGTDSALAGTESGITDDIIVKADSFSVYPNPTSGITTLNLADFNGQEVNVIVVSTANQVVWQNTFNNSHSSEETINLSSLTTGYYYVIVTAGDLELSQPLLIRK
ncbi:malectin domain-containing carbohydrate-binding protein, partial [Eudoraea chungangensis]|uniref:malectin domain-containing carbohydrate-binding protein n=1 Tax=Eudoraea chungangensis TaxID=1481905 RepID=UPI0023EB5213